MKRAPTIALCLAVAMPAGALDFSLPGTATLAAERTEALDGLSLPVGPWREDGTDLLSVEGAITRQAWRIPRTSLTPLQIVAPLRDALTEAGFEILYECREQECGGFDFRYALDLLPEPDMHVDLGDYRYLAARSGPDVISLTASRSADAGFLHVTRVGAPVAIRTGTAPAVEAAVPAGTAARPPQEPEVAAGLADLLGLDGRAVLDDLRFAPGSSELESTLFPSLVALAEWLKRRPEARVVLVGHSDGVGALDSNIALSRARAQSVVTRLVASHGVAPGQLSAEGVGYLAPRARNDTDEGRALNRRVEVVLPGGK